MGVHCCCLHINYIFYEHFDHWSLHIGSLYPTCVQNFRPVSLTVFEIQGFNLKNQNNNNKKKKTNRLNWTINMGDMAKSPFLQFILLSLFFSLNPSISKTVRGTCLKYGTQVGSDDPTCSDLSKCL